MSRGRRVSLEMEARIAELRKQGKTYKEISTELSIGGKPVRRVLNPEAHERQRITRKKRTVDELRVRVNGVRKHFKVKGRRSRPGRCELCSRPPIKKSLSWHHWNNKHLEWGLWLCLHCHIFAEQTDKGIDQKRYLELKAQQERLGRILVKGI